MKSIQLVHIGQPLETREVPVPTVGFGDILIRVRAAGICHSDAHYRAGHSPMGKLPITLGHEIAGAVEKIGPNVKNVRVGERVCVHYLLTCGNCDHCRAGDEQFCRSASMVGHHSDGGFAEYIAVPSGNAVSLPDNISFEHGAVMSCSSVTSLHALRKARLRKGESVAIFGLGGLGMSGVQLARALGASTVFGVDTRTDRTVLAELFGAKGVDAAKTDPVEVIRRMTDGRGVDVALELIGLPATIHQAVECLAPKGRAVVAGISTEPVLIDTYRDLLGKEAELIGSNDHFVSELRELMTLAEKGMLDLSSVVTHSLPLEADAINNVLDMLLAHRAPVRSVISM